MQINRAANHQELGKTKKKPFAPRVLIRENSASWTSCKQHCRTVCYKHSNRFLISCGEVLRSSQSSSLLQLSFPVNVGVTNQRPSSDSELISRMGIRLLACVTRACEQVFRGALAAGREKEGELATMYLEFEFHLQFPCASP